MTALGFAPVETVTVDEAQEPRNEDALWHIPADHLEEIKADTGKPWRALCGQARDASRGSRWEWELAPMEKCAICTDLAFGSDDE